MAGVVSTHNGPLPNTHLVLYQWVNGRVGSTTTKKMLTSTMTDAYGSYHFNHMLPGTYALDVDIVGKAPYELGNILIDDSGIPVTKDIVVDQTAVSESAPTIPCGASLAQNYPNPFGTATTVSYALAAPATVDLSVFDMTGRCVASLAQGVTEAGAHTTSLQASLRPGVYTLMLRANGAVATRMMTVVR